MNIHRVSVGLRLLPLVALLPLSMAYTPLASAAEGETTPGLTVSAMAQAKHAGDSPISLHLNVRSEQVMLDEAGSCRPKDANLKCWGSLRLRVADMGGMLIGSFEVHRIALVGEGEGGHGEDHGDDHGDDHNHAIAPMAKAAAEGSQRIAVSGVGVIKRPGTSGFARGTLVQVKIMLTDNGSSRNGDTVDVTVNEFVEGPSKPLIYQSGAVNAQQVRYRGGETTG